MQRLVFHLFLSLLSLIGFALEAQSPPIPISSAPISDGWGSWRSLDTKHFSIHFPKDRKEYAYQAAKLFEQIHAKLAPLYARPWITYKTNVALIFSSDTSQGWATSIGINQIVLYLETPQLGNFSRYEDWLELLFTHEYTHILSLQIWEPDKTMLSVFRLLFGVPPNFASPRAFIEGVAVWEESKTGLGRLRDPLTQMIVRTAVWEDDYPPLDVLLNTPQHWPRASLAYLYGGALMAELERQAGTQAPRRYWATDRNPLAIGSRLNDLGVQLNELYAGMKKRDLGYFGEQISQLKKEGLTPYEGLTFDGDVKTFLTYDSEKHELIYYARPSHLRPGVFRIQLDQTRPKAQHIRKQITNRGIASAKGKRFYSSDHILYPAFGTAQELHDANRAYLFSRMAPGRSISYPSLSADAQYLYFIERKKKWRLLKAAKLKKGTLGSEEVLLHAKYEGILQYTATSPDGNYLASLYRQDKRGYAKLILCRLSQNRMQSCQVAAEAKAVIAQPCFSQDSRQLLFTSDLNGIYNIYAFIIEKNLIYRLTRTLTGLFYPAAGRDALYAIAYFKRGYDIVRLEYQNLLKENVNGFSYGTPIFLGAPAPETKKEKQSRSPQMQKPELGQKERSQENVKEEKAEKWLERDYSPLREWRPYYTGILDIGKTASSSLYFWGSVEARDPLQWHTLGASLGSFTREEAKKDSEEEGEKKNTSTPGALYYLYNRYKLGLSLSYTRDEEFTEIRQAYLSYIRPSRFLSLQALAGYKHKEHFKSFRATDARPKLNYEYSLGGPALILLLGNTHHFGSSISPEKGWSIFAEASYYTRENSKLRNYEVGERFSPVLEEKSLSYGLSEGGLALYLPSFFDHHVNYLAGYGYAYFGPDRKERYHEQGNLVRNADPELFEGRSFVVYSYEYRFPLFWGSPWLSKPWPYFSFRYVSLAPFYDYGIVKNKNRSYRTWAYGLKMGIALDIFYLSLPEMTFSVSYGKNSERLYSFFISTDTSRLSSGNEKQRQINKITRPYRHLPPQMKKSPGYFHNR